MNRTQKGKSQAAVDVKASAWRWVLPYIFPALYHLLRLSLALIFIYAGLVKLMNPKAFAHALAQFELIPDSLLPIVALGLPGVELLAGLGLAFDLRFCMTAILVMLTGFLLILGYAILQDLDIDCGCFTLDELTERTSVKMAFFRDLLMLATMGFLFWWRRSRAKDLWEKSVTG
jgi:uncharacterized membrane protein YphA (DoxX/SURF4 family)